MKDLCTRKIVGYAFSDRIDKPLTLVALGMAYGIRRSMFRRGAPYDNAVTENFFSCLKCELILLKQYPTRAAAQNDVFVYLEAFYNTVRPHSALG